MGWIYLNRFPFSRSTVLYNSLFTFLSDPLVTIYLSIYQCRGPYIPGSHAKDTTNQSTYQQHDYQSTVETSYDISFFFQLISS
ncbi:uncharacterized protein BO95DRAFT_179504 [Aspergillus brunneoviolaceus CBS 621.78]|uniref:Uncharacterized protein n=1 Tax=Aspergillus brunneoviolaceus CBS 621.78 TaxID=1450534 RepID=A0ACD1G594_9EURO|nr:hypothetical protein BO95DRAFT_179504 [Aspergillus brunneoviolaceus CBS 621.78]RAH44393.1 hypothetical protein BO95DRAFT_179504 [Aspergillus brunneoviolaceus CBS 621.78]